MTQKLQNFRTEPATECKEPILIKIYPSSNDGLPLDIDPSTRFAKLYGQSVHYLERIRNFKVRPDDVWVISMPKCGTTWMLELAWMLAHDLNYESALTVEQEERCPFFEFCTIYPPRSSESLDSTGKTKSPRVIKTHLPVHLLPKAIWTVKPKLIYVIRDPKDAAISNFYFLSGLGKTKSSKEDFLNKFMYGDMIYHPFWMHCVEFWKLRRESFIYYTSFERMKTDLRRVIGEVSTFLEKPLTDEQIDKLEDHLSFEKMKKNPMCNHLTEIKKIQEILGNENSFSFIRKGVVGSHKEEITDDMIRKFDEWTKKYLEPYALTSEELLLLN